jgi:hypothetical protein
MSGIEAKPTVNSDIWVDYTNHRGERRWRHIIPTNHLKLTSTPYHTEMQWLLECWDIDRKDFRSYALLTIHGFSKEEPK